MTEKLKNITGLFKNTRTRIIILLTIFLVVGSIVVGMYVLGGRTGVSPGGASLVSPSAHITAVPGGMEPTTQYAKLVEEHNIKQAEEAKKTGKSVLPTIVRFQKYGEGQTIPPAAEEAGEAGLSFSTLAERQRFGVGKEKEVWSAKLKETNCSAAAVSLVREQGALLQDLVPMCSCTQLKAQGFNAKSLKEVCECPALKSAGFNIFELKDAGFNAGQLMLCGFDACQVKVAGFTAQEMKTGGFTEGELKGAGFSERQIKEAAGLPEGVMADEVIKAGCDPNELRRLRAAGVKAEAIRQLSGCEVRALKTAGFDATELKNAGFSIAELKRVGFSLQELLNANLELPELIAAGFNADQLKAAGITVEDLKKAGASATQLKLAGFDLKELMAAGFNGNELAAAGFTEAQFKVAGVTAEEFKKLSISPQQLKPDLSADLIRQIQKAGDNPTILRKAKDAGLSAAMIRRQAGSSLAALKTAGFSISALKQAGYTAAELRAAGFSAQALRAAGYVAGELKNAGFSASALKLAGYSVNELKNAGYDANALRAAGFTAGQLKAAGLSVSDLQKAGYTVKELKEAGFSAAEFKAAKFDSAQLQEVGFSANELIAAGYTAKELKEAGFSAEELKKAGFRLNQLAGAGFTAQQLTMAGFTHKELELAGLTVSELPPSAAIPGAAKATPETSREAQLQQILAQQAAQLSDQHVQQQIQQKQSTFRGNFAQTMAEWAPVAQVYVAGSPLVEEKTIVEAKKIPGAKGSETRVVGQPIVTGEGVSFKAGDIVFAVLDTAVNSDEPGPILATVVSGPLKGSKLMGSLTIPSDGQKVMLSFNRLSMPNASKTISINTIAIDPETARTALSSYTNNHYVQRYGALFASAFMEGFGNAVQSSGTTVSFNNAGQTTVAQAQRSMGDNALIGAGRVGQRWGSQIGRVFNRPPTVEVYSGTAMGIMFLDDIAINQAEIIPKKETIIAKF